MAEHHASATVNATSDRVFALFSHFNDYPKFMTYVKEVTYLDDTRSHWVVDMLGQHEWDAVNEEWIPGRQIGWRSTSGVVNSGRVRFEPRGERTLVTVDVRYDPPGGPIGTIGEALGAGTLFEQRLQRDLDHFAAMVEASPADALDPASSTFLFHAESAAAKGETTISQNQTMATTQDMPNGALADTPSTTSITNE